MYRKEEFSFNGLVKNKQTNKQTNKQKTKLHCINKFSTQNHGISKISASGLICKYFLKFHKFQPSFSNEVYSCKKGYIVRNVKLEILKSKYRNKLKERRMQLTI